MTKIASARIQPSPRIDSWNACAVPWKLPVTVAGSVVARELLDLRDRVAERDAGLQVERERHRRQLADVVDRLRPDALLRGRRPRTAAPACRSGACT